MFAAALCKHNCALPVKRLAAGKYLFGTKQILAKIINGKLVIRVGGGYMSVDEFIEQYGKIEMLKMVKAGQIDGDADMSKQSGRGSQGNMDGPAMSMGDMKAMMRQSLGNVKTYETGNQFGLDRRSTKGD